jgi:hypothetical protein
VRARDGNLSTESHAVEVQMRNVMYHVTGNIAGCTAS